MEIVVHGKEFSVNFSQNCKQKFHKKVCHFNRHRSAM